MKILDKFMGNPIDKMKSADLIHEQMRLNNQIEKIKKEIKRIEEKKKVLFKEGVGADYITKKMAARRIKQLEKDKELKMKGFENYHNQYTLISNLLTIKKYKSQIKKSQVWSKFSKMNPDKLEDALYTINIEGKNADEVINNLNGIFEIDLAESSYTKDEEVEDIINAMDAVDAGELDINEAEEKILKKKKEKMDFEED